MHLADEARLAFFICEHSPDCTAEAEAVSLRSQVSSDGCSRALHQDYCRDTLWALYCAGRDTSRWRRTPG